MKRTQQEALEKQFKEAEDKLENDMVQAVSDYEAEINRRGIVNVQFPGLESRYTVVVSLDLLSMLFVSLMRISPRINHLTGDEFMNSEG